MKAHYSEELLSVGRQLIEQYRDGQQISCGINGPYDDVETRIRNLCHLIVITSIEVNILNQDKYLQDIITMTNDLISERNRRDGLYVLRMKEGKDGCNGVIGHAWVIEALVYAWKASRRDEYIEEARRIAKKHKINEKLGLWYIPDKNAVIDYTLNHQLWYAASVAELLVEIDDEEIERQFSVFMNSLGKNFTVSHGGRISHLVKRTESLKGTCKEIIKKYINFCKELLGMPSLRYKESGYHLFNIVALARIYKLKKHEFFLSKKFLGSIEYMNRTQFLMGLLDKNIQLDNSLHNEKLTPEECEVNIYGYPYNVPGFELLYVSSIIEGKIKKECVDECYAKQIELIYKKVINGEKSVCHDTATIKYRIYEYYRFLEEVYEEIGQKNANADNNTIVNTDY